MASVIVITGASRGIGAAIAKLAGEQGYGVCVNYRADHDAAQSVVRDIELSGSRAVAVKADISYEADVIRLFDEAEAQLGPPSVLVNNAGILEPQMKLATMTGDRIRRIFEVNVVGCFLCAREAIRRMSTDFGGSGGSIVNISSGAALTGAPGEYVDYAASKGALDTMTIGLAREVASEGIRVNGVRPGYIETELHSSGGDSRRLERVLNRIPLGRIGLPSEVAMAVLWLCSGEASYTTGSFLDVTGGK